MFRLLVTKYVPTFMKAKKTPNFGATAKKVRV